MTDDATPVPHGRLDGRPGDPARRGRPGRAGRPSVLTDLAPGVDRAWAETFVLELRLADVPGRRIGDALVEVGSHCAESGESATEAFGDPAAYARSLDLPREPPGDLVPFGSLVPWTLQALGLLLSGSAATALRSGEPLDVTTGHVAAGVLLVLSMLALTRWASRVMDVALRRPVALWLGLMAHLGLMVAVFLVLRDVVARVPGGPALAVCVAALLGGSAWAVLTVRRDPAEEDPISATIDPSEGRVSRVWSVLRYGPALMMPVTGVVFVAVGLASGA